MSTIIVTGANRGIGLGLTKAFLERGDTVVGTYRVEDRSRELLALASKMRDAGDGRLHPIVMEQRDQSSIATCRDRVAGLVDHLDVLVNNAGMGDGNVDMPDPDAFNTLGRLRGEAMLDMLAANSVGPVLVTQAFLPLLERAEAARVVHITSIMGSIAGRVGPGEYGYCCSKTALNMMGSIMAADLGPRGMVVAILHPGWVRTTLGGPDAPMTVEQSVAGLVRVIDGLTPEMNGGFFDFLGRRMPW
jgi:NAD(P)-dependent dehydrogenase (short-subunit alcohol dehydrogenase family)